MLIFIAPHHFDVVLFLFAGGAYEKIFSKAIISSLRSSVGENIRVFNSEIPFSVRAAECSLSGESIFSHDKNGRVAAAYEALTKEVTEIEERAKNRSGPDRVR